jgi:phage FluMu protein gp41
MKKQKELKCKELLLEGDAEVEIISLVNKPAIEVDFLKFAEAERMIFTETDKKIITGPALIPKKLIYRIDEATGEEYNVFFSEDTIKKISEQYLAKFNQANVNLEHEIDVSGICLSESWLIDDPEMDKAKALGFNLPKGTWMVSMKVNNQEVWDDIKAGNYKGFSIEGYLVKKMSIQHNRTIINQALTEAEMLLEKIKKILKDI